MAAVDNGRADARSGGLVRTVVLVTVVLSAYVLIVDWSAIASAWRHFGSGAGG